MDEPSHTEAALSALAAHRASIDNIDAALVCLLGERFKVTTRIGVLKAAHGLPAVDARRESEQRERLLVRAAESGLDPLFALAFYEFVRDEVVKHHRRSAREHRVSPSKGATPADA